MVPCASNISATGSTPRSSGTIFWSCCTSLDAHPRPRGRYRLAPAGAGPDQAPRRVSRHGGAADAAGRGGAAGAARRQPADRGADPPAAQDRGVPPGAARHHRPALRRHLRAARPGRTGAAGHAAAAHPVRLRPGPAAVRRQRRGRAAGTGARRLRPLHRDRDPGRGAGRRRPGRRGAQGAARRGRTPGRPPGAPHQPARQSGRGRDDLRHRRQPAGLRAGVVDRGRDRAGQRAPGARARLRHLMVADRAGDRDQGPAARHRRRRLRRPGRGGEPRRAGRARRQPQPHRAQVGPALRAAGPSQPPQVGVPRQYQPRAADPAQCHSRLHRADPGRYLRRGA